MRLAYRPLALWISTAATAKAAFRPASTTAAFLRNRHSAPYSAIARSMSSNDSNASSDTLRVALCQFPVTHDKEVNHATCSKYMSQACDQGAQLIVLPEIWNSPYATSAFPEYAESLPTIGDSSASSSPSSALLIQHAKEHKVWIVGGSIPETEKDGKVYNTCLVIDPSGTIVAKHRKVHLFDIDVPGGITFFESDTLSPGTTFSQFSIPNLCDIGVGICYDIRFAEYAMLLCQSNKNCKVLIYPGAFNMTTGPAHWELLQRARALDNQCFVVTASPARTEPPAEEGKYPHYTAWGHSTVVSPWGDVVAKADEKEALIMVDLNLAKVEEVRKSIPIGKQKRNDMYKMDMVVEEK